MWDGMKDKMFFWRVLGLFESISFAVYAAMTDDIFMAYLAGFVACNMVFSLWFLTNERAKK